MVPIHDRCRIFCTHISYCIWCMLLNRGNNVPQNTHTRTHHCKWVELEIGGWLQRKCYLCIITQKFIFIRYLITKLKIGRQKPSGKNMLNCVSRTGIHFLQTLCFVYQISNINDNVIVLLYRIIASTTRLKATFFQCHKFTCFSQVYSYYWPLHCHWIVEHFLEVWRYVRAGQ